MNTYTKKKITEFSKKGYTTINISEAYIKKFLSLKKNIINKSQKYFLKDEIKLENFHKHKINKAELNDFRIEIMKLINSYKNIKEIIYLSLGDFMDYCLGPDVIVQKNVNLVIQTPNDNNRAPFHKDAPVASNYELVVWIPLVNCTNTMCMYLFDIDKHEKSKKFLLKNNSDKKFDLFSKKNGHLLNVKFGQALIFWTNNFHYIPINKENRTRWSLNIRYKNLFTQYGTKNLLDYYEILKLSPITNLLNKIDV